MAEGLTRDESDLLQEQLLPAWKEWQAGGEAPKAEGFFLLATAHFCTFSGSASFTRVLKLLSGRRWLFLECGCDAGDAAQAHRLLECC